MARNFTVDNKVKLLEHLIETSQTWRDPDLAAFFTHAQSSFKGFGGTTWAGADLEGKLRNEERHWLRECAGSRSRRRGHERGSHYDNAMTKWKKIWDQMLIKDWQNEVDTGRPVDDVPEILRDKVVRPRALLSARDSPPNERIAQNSLPPPQARPTAARVDPNMSPATSPNAQTTTAKDERLQFGPDGDPLKRVVDSAMERARHIGKPDLADAVQMIYDDSLQNLELRFLLERILKHTADPAQNTRFQDYVQAAKRKIKMQKAQQQKSELDKEGDRRMRKLLYRQEVAKTIEMSTPPATQQGEKLCTEETWSSTCPCTRCIRDKAEYNEDATGIADEEHRRKYEEFVRINGLDAGKTKGPWRAPPLPHQHKEETKATPTQQPSSDDGDGDGGVRIVDTPDAQLGAEQMASEQIQQGPSRANGSPAPADTAFPSDSGYETTEKQPHHDPLVNKVLGNLQYVPSVEKLLQHNRALPTNANIKDLRQRQSALEAIKTIITDTPAAKTDLNVLAEKLQERDTREARENGEISSEEHATAGAENESEDDDELIDVEESQDEYEENLTEDITPRSKRSLRPRLSTAEVEEAERPNTERRRNHKWPCPLAKVANCDQWFSSSGHAVRHGKIHTGVKDFTCPACDKPFARKDNMMEHFRGVHKNRVPSKKRDRRSSTQSSTAVTEEADRQAEERAAKRRKSTRQAQRARKDDVESGASRDSSVISNLSSMSSLTEMSSAYDAPAKSKSAHAASNFPHLVTRSRQVVGQYGDALEPESTTLARLEAKLDALLSGRPSGTSSTSDAEHAMVSSAETLLRIATSLQSGAMNGQSPELTQFVARLTRTAAEAVIEASNSAKNSAAMARDISLMLEEHAGGHGPAA